MPKRIMPNINKAAPSRAYFKDGFMVNAMLHGLVMFHKIKLKIIVSAILDENSSYIAKNFTPYAFKNCK
jgi:hypothetical protein